MRFLIDEQLPATLARWIVASGHESQHVLDIGLGGAVDNEIWQHVKQMNANIITEDQDFLALARMDPTVGVVYLRSGNLSRTALLQQMEKVFDDVCEALA